MYLYADGMLLYLKCTKYITRKLQNQINTLSKVTSHKINIQNQIPRNKSNPRDLRLVQKTLKHKKVMTLKYGKVFYPHQF